MFEFLFGKKPTKKAAPETLRQTAERSVKELNAVLEALPDQPAITLCANGAGIRIDWPEQMPDEAPALPAPETAPETAAETAKDDAPTGKTPGEEATSARGDAPKSSETKAA